MTIVVNAIGPPRDAESSFKCPHCGVVAQQHWTPTNSTFGFWIDDKEKKFEAEKLKIRLSRCQDCKKTCLWEGTKMLYPEAGVAILPALDMPDGVKKTYLEAGGIAQKSPVAAAALLRLALEELCLELGAKGRSVQEKIDYLKKEKGISPRMVKAMQIVRFVGNNAVHPGLIDFDDDGNIVKALFKLINLTVEELITKDKEIDAMYEDIVPAHQKQKDFPPEGGGGG